MYLCSVQVILITTNAAENKILNEACNITIDINEVLDQARLSANTQEPLEPGRANGRDASGPLTDPIEQDLIGGKFDSTGGSTLVAEQAVGDPDYLPQSYGSNYHERYQQFPLDSEVGDADLALAGGLKTIDTSQQPSGTDSSGLPPGLQQSNVTSKRLSVNSASANEDFFAALQKQHDYTNQHIGEGSVETPTSNNTGFTSSSKFIIPGAEESALFRDFEHALESCNVGLAVCTLRKIYTKQTKTFNIPDVLLDALASKCTSRIVGGVAVQHMNTMTILFVLSCIQWCFGVQGGEHIESFKYKMNKNIAKWFLKCVSQLHNSDVPLTPDIHVSAKTVVCHILESVAEMEFCLEILETMEVENVQEVLMKHVAFWTSSDNKALSAKAEKFAMEHNLPLQEYKDAYGDSFEGTNGNPYINDCASHSSGDPSSLHPSTSSKSAIISKATFSLDDRGGVAGGVAALENLTSEQLMSLPVDRLTPDQKLFLLIVRSPRGLLGARVPSLYREHYSERLRLQGRKLKDVILISKKIEMIGSDGPGDKLFQLVNPEEYAYLHEHNPVVMASHNGEEESGAASGQGPSGNSIVSGDDFFSAHGGASASANGSGAYPMPPKGADAPGMRKGSYHPSVQTSPALSRGLIQQGIAAAHQQSPHWGTGQHIQQQQRQYTAANTPGDLSLHQSPSGYMNSAPGMQYQQQQQHQQQQQQAYYVQQQQQQQQIGQHSGAHDQPLQQNASFSSLLSPRFYNTGQDAPLGSPNANAAPFQPAGFGRNVRTCFYLALK